MPTRSLDARPLGRRGVLAAGGLGGLALVGCSSSAGSDSDRAAGSAPVTQPSLAPDVAVATNALKQIRAARVAVESTIQRFPALHVELDRVVAMHQAHEASLKDAVPRRASTTASPTPYAVPGRRPAALTRLAATEQRLHASLDGLALSAQSGDFARLLAAMGAGVGQRLAGWPQ